MATATAMILEAPRMLTRHELPLPRGDDRDGLLRIEACGLCGTDHEQYAGVLPAGFAFVPGHEVIGVIERVGNEAARRWEVEEGDRVAVEVFQSCERCDACRRGDYRLCSRHGIGDMYGFIPVTKEPGLWGGYATHQYLAPDSRLLRVPEGIDPVLATLFNPLGAGIRWGVTVPGTKPGDVVAVLGPGVRGLSVTAAVREAGAEFILITGRGERDAGRLEVALDFGADLAVDVEAGDPTVALRDAVGRLADVVIDVTACAPSALAQAVSLARPGGTVVVAGTRGSAATPGFHPDNLVYKELRLQGVLGVDTAAYLQALELLAGKRYPFDQLPRRVSPLEDVEDLVRTMGGETQQVPPVHAVTVP